MTDTPRGSLAYGAGASNILKSEMQSYRVVGYHDQQAYQP